MAGETAPRFLTTAWQPQTTLASATTGRTVTGTTGLTALGSAVANTYGRYVDRVVFVPTGNTTLGLVRVWLYTGSGNALLLQELEVPAVTADNDTAQVQYTLLINQLIPNGSTLYVSSYTSDAWNIFGFGSE
jgi:hypothetical protein